MISVIPVDFYGTAYRGFGQALYAEIREEAFGEDIGQTGWLTVEEHDRFISWLGLSPSSHLLDLGCGSGLPTLRLAQETGCRVFGLDLHPDGIVQARATAKELGFEGRAEFRQGDAADRLPLPDSQFDAIICIDAIGHLPDRPSVLHECRRLLRPGGRLLFTDPIVLTGPVTDEELAVRASTGVFTFVPADWNEKLLEQTGFEIEHVEDRTQNLADTAAAWRKARMKRESHLRAVEGDKTFDGQQRFLETTALLARERRLSRSAFLARKPS